MKTSHQIARELLALPDEQLYIEMWCEMDDHEIQARYYEANDGGIILIYERSNKPKEPNE